ncbi:hypothetical protein [Marinobacterium sp. BA1]|uniref:hypothetical protein n=1 Tax=Marinobacterium sp. BA1 TaxID=3138931 RepID=UPI0032E75754
MEHHILIDADNQPARMVEPLMHHLYATGIEHMPTLGHTLNVHIAGNGNGCHVERWHSAMEDRRLTITNSVVVPSIADGADLYLSMIAGQLLARANASQRIRIIIVSRDDLLIRLAQMINTAADLKHKAYAQIMCADSNCPNMPPTITVPFTLIPTEPSPRSQVLVLESAITKPATEGTAIEPDVEGVGKIPCETRLPAVPPQKTNPTQQMKAMSANAVFNSIVRLVMKKHGDWKVNKLIPLEVFERAVQSRFPGVARKQVRDHIKGHVCQVQRGSAKCVQRLK